MRSKSSSTGKRSRSKSRSTLQAPAQAAAPVGALPPPQVPTQVQNESIEASIEEKLRQQQQKTALFAEVTLNIRQSLQLKDIFHTTVTEVQRLLQADRVLIYQVLSDGTGKAVSEAVLPDYPALLELEFPEEVFPEDYQVLYAQGRVRAIADVNNPAFGLSACLVDFVRQFQIRSKLIVPILQNPKIYQNQASPTRAPLWGLLIAHHCRSPRP